MNRDDLMDLRAPRAWIFLMGGVADLRGRAGGGARWTGITHTASSPSEVILLLSIFYSFFFIYTSIFFSQTQFQYFLVQEVNNIRGASTREIHLPSVWPPHKPNNHNHTSSCWWPVHHNLHPGYYLPGADRSDRITPSV